MKPHSYDAPTLVSLIIWGAVTSGCGGGGASDSGAQALLHQQPNVASAAIGGAAHAASAASTPEPTASSSASTTAQASIFGETSSRLTAGTAATPAIASSVGLTTLGSDSASGSTSTNVANSINSAVTSAAGTAHVVTSSATQSHGVAPGVSVGSVISPAATAARCEIDQTKNFAGSCWASIKDVIPSGSNRSYANARANYVGSVNANCVEGKTHWSTGLCKPIATAAATASRTTVSPPPAASDYKIGTFYFPGWRDNQAGAPAKQPWERIKAYPEREPLLGWYDDGSVAIMEQQLKWMRSYGIDYVFFDWYWNGKAAALTHSIEAYLKTQAKKDVPFALLWANHTGVPRTKLEFTAMVDYWIKNYFDRPEFMKIDGKPVIFVFSHPDFVKQAAQVGESYTALLTEAEGMARQAGYKGIYFIGGTHVDFGVFKAALTSGYSAFSGYNYHGLDKDSSISYEELDGAYQHIWNVILKNSSIPYIIPMTQGWDRRPWGGSPNPLHDLSGGVASDFEHHLVQARKLMDANPIKTLKMGIICCWNEFGEGSFIEPTKKDGLSYLEKVHKVFGSP